MTETERDRDVRDLFARIRVVEAIQNHLLVGVARHSKSPNAFFKEIMQSAERSLHEAKRTATENQMQAADDAIVSFNDRSMRLIAGLSPRGTPQ